MFFYVKSLVHPFRSAEHLYIDLAMGTTGNHWEAQALSGDMALWKIRFLWDICNHISAFRKQWLDIEFYSA